MIIFHVPGLKRGAGRTIQKPGILQWHARARNFISSEQKILWWFSAAGLELEAETEYMDAIAVTEERSAQKNIWISGNIWIFVGMAINLTNLTRWDIFDKKTTDVFKECRGGVLQKEQRKELANHITRPTDFLCRLYQMLQESNKLNTEQKRVCKYLLLYPHKSQVYGDKTAWRCCYGVL